MNMLFSNWKKKEFYASYNDICEERDEIVSHFKW
jgi:hypothetical protein